MAKFHIVRRGDPSFYLWKAPNPQILSPYMWGTEEDMQRFLDDPAPFLRDKYGADLKKVCSRDFTGDETAHYLTINNDVTVLEIEAPLTEEEKASKEAVIRAKIAVVSFVLGVVAIPAIRGYF